MPKGELDEPQSAKLQWKALCTHVRDEQIRITEEYKIRVMSNIERRENLVKDFIYNVVNPLLAESELTAATCNLTSKKHKSARALIEHLTFF